MKLKDIFITYNQGDHQLMVAVDTAVFSGIAKSNSSAAFIIDCLKQETTKEELLAKMEEKYEASPEQLNQGIDTVLEQLRKIQALEE